MDTKLRLRRGRRIFEDLEECHMARLQPCADVCLSFSCSETIPANTKHGGYEMGTITQNYCRW